ncbi:MAG: hypothetical protein KDD41_06405 [Flavobacteriales bacterium]|nr:hypothetical protein [Flavobacteriales bacterium]
MKNFLYKLEIEKEKISHKNYVINRLIKEIFAVHIYNYTRIKVSKIDLLIDRVHRREIVVTHLYNKFNKLGSNCNKELAYFIILEHFKSSIESAIKIEAYEFAHELKIWKEVLCNPVSKFLFQFKYLSNIITKLLDSFLPLIVSFTFLLVFYLLLFGLFSLFNI